jgi:hypothetical protein
MVELSRMMDERSLIEINAIALSTGGLDEDERDADSETFGQRLDHGA